MRNKEKNGLSIAKIKTQLVHTPKFLNLYNNLLALHLEPA